MGKYICADYFMIRTPMLPVEVYKQSIEQNNIYEFINSNSELKKYFEKALIVSSRSLYNTWINGTNSKKAYDKLNLSIFKYLIRATVRPTPFGYFAAVSLGKFGEKESLERTDDFLVVEPDYEWIKNLICILEQDKSIRNNLKLFINKNCYKYGSRYYNPYCTNARLESSRKIDKKESNIKNSTVVRHIADIIEKNNEYINVKKLIKDEYQNVNDDTIENTLQTLIDREYIFTNLQIPSFCQDKLKYIYNIIENDCKNKEITKKIEKLISLIDTFNSNERNKIENTVESIDNIYGAMDALHSRGVSLKADTGMKINNAMLPYSIKHNIEKFADTIINISIQNENYKTLDIFIESFYEEYGLEVDVKLTDIINPNGFNGLEMISDNAELKIDHREKEIKRIIGSKILHGLKEKREINFKKEDFSNIESLNPESHVSSFDINLFINRVENDYYYTMGPNAGSINAGAMFQRFAKCFDKNEFDKYNQIYEKIENAGKSDVINIEIIEEPSLSKIRNIINETKNYKYSFTLGTTHFFSNYDISLNDIYIGIDRNMKPYLKTNNGEKVRFISDNMLFIGATSKLTKLLQFISTYAECNPLARFFEFSNMNYEYIPRIKIEDIVVSPERWNFIEKNDLSKISFKEEFISFYRRNGIRKKFYLCENDNRLLIDIDNELCMDVLYSEFKKKKELHLCELEKGIIDNPIITRENSSFIGEFVFSIYINNAEQQSVSLHNTNQENKLLDNNRTMMLFEQGWIYLKIYGLGDRTNDFLISELDGIIEQMNYPKLFFIRYIDKGGKHIRLRFKFSDRESALNNIGVLAQWIRRKTNENTISEGKLENYIKEINRYGGYELHPLCEEIFMIDSFLVVCLLRNYDMKNSEIMEKIYCRDIIFYLKHFFVSEERALTELENIGYHKKNNKDYKRKDKLYQNILEEIYKEGEQFDLNIGKPYEMLAQKITELREKMYDGKNTTTSNTELAFSVIHMHCNRLLGDRVKESHFMENVRAALYHKVKKNEYMKNN